MSNKYQEALDYVNKSVCTSLACLGIEDNKTREYLHTLQELVNKETPKKAIMYNTNQFICPKCQKQIKGQKMIYNNQTRKFDIKCKIKCEKTYCPYCGNKLDWSE